MARERNIRDVFGVDYLLNTPSLAPPAFAAPDTAALVPPASQFAAKSLAAKAQEAKRIMQMREILVRLHALNGRSRLHILIDQPPTMTIDFSEFLSVVGELEKAELLQVIERERFGNWDVEITPAGRKFLTDTAI